MNKSFRLIWSDARQTWLVAHEAAVARGKPSRRLTITTKVAGALTSLACFYAGAQAPAPGTLPTGGQVVAGQAAIRQAGNAMTIQQDSARAILNWNSFSIGSQASVNFQQPSASAVALNRVLGSNPSAIYGSLTANGQVFLVNPSGVVFGPSARVDVAGMVASTLNIRDEDFLLGNYRFSRDFAAASLINEGELLGKYVALLAPEVRNEGVILARQGTAALAAGEVVTLNIAGSNLVSVQVDKASIDTLVENRRLVQADGGLVVLSAQSAHGLVGKVVNTGIIGAGGIVSDGGTIRLVASSAIEHSGSIQADAGTNGKGGEVILLADLANPQSSTIVSGDISARGGSESGDGGFIETSASRLSIGDRARIDTRAVNARTGQWLLDPFDFTVAAVGGDITGSALSTALGSNDVIIQTLDASAGCTGATCAAGNASGNGDIFVNDAVTWGSSQKLTLSAWRNVAINAPVNVNGAGGSLALEFAQSGTELDFPAGVYQINAPVNLATGTGFSTKAASDGALINYTVINDAAALAAISGNLAGSYVLGSDVAAPGSSWAPLGNTGTPFTGNFDGLGHKITGLMHTNAGSDVDVGLFGGSVGLIQNVGVTGVNIAGSQNVGALVGINNGFVVNSYATGTVTGSGAGDVGRIGGLVGFSMGPIQGSYADVTVTATTGNQTGNPLTDGRGGIGGLAGVVGTSVLDSYAKGSVTGGRSVGGLAGYSAAAITNSYSTGAVTGTANVGGLVGGVDYGAGFPFIFGSFWDTTTSGQVAGGGTVDDFVTGLTTAQMQTPSNFTGAGWDTTFAWELRDGQYPLLKQLLQPIFVHASNTTTTYSGLAVTSAGATVAPGTATGGDFSGTAISAPTATAINTGTYTLAASGLTLTNPGSQTGYRIETVNATLTIDPATLTYVADAKSRTFGAANPALTGTVTGFVNSETQGTATTGTLIFSTAADTSSIVGSYAIDGSGLTANNGNYLFLQAPGNSTALTINPALLSLDTTASKTYDGTNIFNNSHSYVLTGMVNSDPAPTVVSGTATVASANAGTYNSFVTNSLSLSNANYTLSGGTVSATIDPKALNVSVTKTYDASADFTSGFNFTGMVGIEAAPTVNSGTATVSSANAATYNSFTSSTLALSNANYTLAGGTVSATIDPKALNVSVSKTYDASADFTSGFNFTGMVGIEAAPTVSSGTATVSSANAATYNSFASSTLALSNANYTLAGGTVSAIIDPKALNVSGQTAANKIYDALTTATLVGGALVGVVGDDTVTLSSGTGTFVDKNVGTGKAVTVTGTGLAGIDAGNYAVSDPVGLTADI
ncbi:MAG: YDG domain-containing protein, partial [Sulfuritalea sp.]|nr:YDG domain-containing protein [Sulfuritalea sp.]